MTEAASIYDIEDVGEMLQLASVLLNVTSRVWAEGDRESAMVHLKGAQDALREVQRIAKGRS